MIYPMPSDDPLDRLEADVLARVAAYRTAQRAAGWVKLDVSVTLIALVIGLAIGHWVPHGGTQQRGSESVVLAEDTRLAPSTLLAGTP